MYFAQGKKHPPKNITTMVEPFAGQAALPW
jgi:hypothetical protein